MLLQEFLMQRFPDRLDDVLERQLLESCMDESPVVVAASQVYKEEARSDALAREERGK